MRNSKLVIEVPNTVEIEDNIPIPETRAGKAGSPKYPFASLKKGQSFVVPYLGVCVKLWAEKTGFEFTTRILTVDGKKHTRVWRVK